MGIGPDWKISSFFMPPNFYSAFFFFSFLASEFFFFPISSIHNLVYKTDTNGTTLVLGGGVAISLIWALRFSQCSI